MITRAILAIALLCTTSPYSGEGSRAADECTSGFMSVDRMDDLLGNEGDVVLDIAFTQGIFPEVNFRCSGSIQSWVFGAQWEGNSDSFTELQIWRPGSEDGSYTKVGNTTIIAEQSSTRLYEYRLSTPLPFQAGDVLGYYQPTASNSQLRLLFEGEGQSERQLGYYYTRDSAASQLNISGPGDTRYTIFLHVVTDPPGCGCGFMSGERMKLLLGLDNIGSFTYTDRRQQITRDMRFTCDGMITKWIIGADWGHIQKPLYPELQVWRNVGNTTYQMINGTLIESVTENSNRIYEYDNFSPIPVQAGDILGVFIPRTADSRLLLLSESRNNPINYYLDTSNAAAESPYDTIDILQVMPPVRTRGYHPLVSVEIAKHTASTVLMSSSILQSTSLLSTVTASKKLVSLGTSTSVVIQPSSAVDHQSSPTTTVLLSSTAPQPPSTATDPQPSIEVVGSSDQGPSMAIEIWAVLAVTLLLLVAVLVVMIAIVYELRKRRRHKSMELPQERRTADGLDNSGGDTRGSSIAMNTQQYHETGPLEDPIYESPPNEGEETALYDVPPAENDVEYAEVSQGRVAESRASPGTIKRFDNPLYAHYT